MSPTDLDARLAALLLAIDPSGLNGAIVHSSSSITCEQWFEFLIAVMPEHTPIRRLPSNISEDRLLGGLDFAASLAGGKAVSERGVLAAANDGIIVLHSARTRASTYTHIARTIDRRGVCVERDGFSEMHATKFCTIALVSDDDPTVPANLSDRVAFALELHTCSREAWADPPARELVVAARSHLPRVHNSANHIEALTRAAEKLGVHSARAVLLTLSAARAHAALMSHDLVQDSDVAVAARLVLAPRATVRPELDESEQRESPDDADGSGETHDAEATRDQELNQSSLRDSNEVDPATSESADNTTTSASAVTDIVVRAAAAALPPGLLAAAAARISSSKFSAGRAGNETQDGVRGRQIGIRRGEPRGGARLDLIATLRAAVPMQRVRKNARTGAPARLIELRKDDFRVRRCSTPTTTTTLFVVDASGSAALHRLAEAKGAVELMLAEGYARRDKVALIAFRGSSAELVLSPTHALARARRAIAGMPAGGGTPLATALDLATAVVPQLRRDQSQVVVVVLTDGRANVARDGKGGRARAEAEAIDAAHRIRAIAVDTVWIDTSPRADAFSRALADSAGARYVLLPAPSARGLSNIARAVLGGADQSTAADTTPTALGKGVA